MSRLWRWTTLYFLQYFMALTCAKVPPISIKGNHFFYPNGSQFVVRGVAYQNGGARAIRSNVAKTIIDPLSDGLQCVRDIPFLVKLGVNVVRVYALKTTADHSACMKSFDDASIYVLANLGDGVEDIFRSQTPTWTYEIKERFTRLIDEFHDYGNILGFIVASEVVTDKNRTIALPFVKAAVRDVKNHIAIKGYRDIPVGYTGSEDESMQKTPFYLVCTDLWNNPMIDFYGVTLYSWCGDSNMEASGYQHQAESFRSYPKPVLISEYGCARPSSRSFSEVSAIYGDKDMTHVFSGAIAYQYYNDSYGYGLVNVKGSTVEESPDFFALSSQLVNNSPASTSLEAWPTSTRNAVPCPTLDKTWFAGSSFPPIPSRGICTCMFRSLECASSNDSNDASLDAIEVLCGDGNFKLECLGTSGNATTDQYGAYSVCTPIEQQSWVINQLYLSHMAAGKSAEDVCKAIHGTLQNSEAISTTSDACRIVLRQAGPQGTGTITSTPINLPTATQVKVAKYSDTVSKFALSGGAKAGIITASILGTLGAITLGVFVFAKRKRAKSAPLNAVDSISKQEDLSPAPPLSKRVPTFEADGKNINTIELPDTPIREIAELSPDYEIVELPAGNEYNDEKRNPMG